MGNNLSKLLKKRNMSTGNIELDSFEKSKESIVVNGSNALCWFKFDDGRVLFKEYDNDLEAYGEVLYSVVANRYGVKCAKYDFASYKGKRGTISYDLAFGNDKVAIDGLTLFARYNLDKLPKIVRNSTSNFDVLEMFNKKYNNYRELMRVFNSRYPNDVDKLEAQLVKMFILDVFFDHVDKNLYNLMIVTNQYGMNAEFYSIDNSRIACLYKGEEYITDAITNLLTSDGSIVIEDYLRGGVHGYDVNIKGNDSSPCKDLIDFYYNCDSKQREEIVQFIKNLEIDSAIEDVSKVHYINPLVNSWIKAVFDSRKNFILKKFYHIKDDYKVEHKEKNFFLRTSK